LPADIHDLIDVSREALDKIEMSEDVDKDIPDRDFSFDSVRLRTEDTEFSDDSDNEDEEELPCLDL
jgi:hypothetical protein